MSPSCTCLIQVQNAASLTLPRESTMFSNFTVPGSLRMIGCPPPVFERCSITPIEMDRPSTSLNWAMVTPSTLTWKAYVAIGSIPMGMAGSYSFTADVPLGSWARRKTTNSAGLTGEMPISVTTEPASMTSLGFVSSSHLT